MVYKIADPDYCNAKYNDILKIAFEHSEHFSFYTIKNIHRKEHTDEYFKFMSDLELLEVFEYDFRTPKYSSGQKLHLYFVNKLSEKIISNTMNFDMWNGYDCPEDLTFYHNKIPWFRCISHERIILVNTTNSVAIDKLKQLGLVFVKIDNTNYI